MAVIPNPVAVPGFLEELNRPNDRFRIGFLGRFHPIKNIDRLIRAWSVAGKAAQDGELVLVGTVLPNTSPTCVISPAPCTWRTYVLPGF